MNKYDFFTLQICVHFLEEDDNINDDANEASIVRAVG